MQELKIIVEGPNGRREIPNGSQLLTGERVIGQTRNLSTALPIIEQSGIPIGDYIAALLKPVAIALDKEDCTTCQGKRLVLNFTTALTDKYGVFKSAGIMVDLWKLAKQGDPCAVAAEIKRYLTNGNGSHTS